MKYQVYILKNHKDKLYIGQTSNLANRFSDHSSKEIKYTRSNGGGFRLVYSEDFSTRAQAMKREKQIKGWTRAKKEALVAGDVVLLKKL